MRSPPCIRRNEDQTGLSVLPTLTQVQARMPANLLHSKIVNEAAIMHTRKRTHRRSITAFFCNRITFNSKLCLNF